MSLWNWRSCVAAAAVLIFASGDVGAAQKKSHRIRFLLPAHEVFEKVNTKIGELTSDVVIGSRKLEGTVVLADSDAEEPGTFTEILSDGRARFRMDVPGYGEILLGVEGDAAWRVEPSGEVTVWRGPDAAVWRRMAVLRENLPWEASYEFGSTVGGVFVDGYTYQYYRMLMVPESGEGDYWQVEWKTFEPGKVEFKTPTALGGMELVEMYLTDWRRVDHVLYPHERKTQFGDRTFIQTYTNIVHDPELPEEAFAIPPSVQSVIDDPPLVPAGMGVEPTLERIMASIKVKCAPDKIGETFNELLPELQNFLTMRRNRVTGPPFARFHDYGTEDMQLEVGLPVVNPFPSNDRILSSSLPGGPAAIRWHAGSYDTLRQSYEELTAWIEANGYRPNGASWEVYWTGPQDDPDPAKWRTQILMPVTGGQ